MSTDFLQYTRANNEFTCDNSGDPFDVFDTTNGRNWRIGLVSMVATTLQLTWTHSPEVLTLLSK